MHREERTMTTIYLIRHAEAEGNVFRRIHGQYDSCVTPNGRRQIAALAQRFAGIPVDAVYASDLKRTCLTATAIYRQKGLPLHRDARFREVGLGPWEDTPFGELERRYPAQLHAFSHDSYHWYVEGAECFLQYAHRFYGFKGEAQYLHGHTGVLTIEVEDSVNAGVNMVFPCNEIQKTAWDVLKNFDHALILREDDPLLPAILDVYEKQGIKNGHPNNVMKGEAFKTELATAYPDCRLVVTKETMTVEGMIKIVYDLLKDKLNIAKLTFTSGVNAASAEFETKNEIDRCPLCGIALNENGVCPKCGYKKQ